MYLSFVLTVLALCFAGATEAISRVESSLERLKFDHARSSNSSRHIYKTDFPNVAWNNDDWVLSTTHLTQGHFESRASVANGYIGISVAALGPFFEIDPAEEGYTTSGWPLFTRRQAFATVAGFFDSQAVTNGTNFPWLRQYGYNSVISGLPHWSGLVLDLGNGKYLDASTSNKTISDFSSNFDFKAGVMSWSYTWTPEGNHGSFKIQYRLFANKLNVNQAAVAMNIVSTKSLNVSVVNILDGAAAVRTRFVKSGMDGTSIYSAVHPQGVSNVTAYVYADVSVSAGSGSQARTLIKNKAYLNKNDSSIAQAIPVSLSPGNGTTITKYVGIASSDAFKDPQSVAKNAVQRAKTTGYNKSLRAHVKEWEVVMPDHSVDSYAFPGNKSLPADSNILDDAVIAVANTYYLLQNTASENAISAANNASINVDSISVGGLSSDSYAGQVFWDADVWMHPGLVTSHPKAARRITNYRIALYDQAKRNVETIYQSSQNKTHISSSAAIYPWTSGRYGNCTDVGPCWDYEYHINGDIAMALQNEWVTTGDTSYFRKHSLPIYDSVAELYGSLLQKNGSKWTLTNMTDPDEYANMVDAGAFTMALAAETLQNANLFRRRFRNKPENKTWEDMANNVLMIRENGVTLEYTTMNGSAPVKQADVVLNTFPLDYTNNYTTQDALNDLDYYANKQSPDGPAMTWAIFSIVANRLTSSGCSGYTYAQYSFKPYARAPFYQLSEQLLDNATINGGTRPAFPFLTGHGGANQVTIYGYLGLRLKLDDVLHVDPDLPPQVPYIRYRTFYWQGWPITAWSNYTHTHIKHATKVHALPGANSRFSNGSITVRSGSDSDYKTYRLRRGSSLTIPNRQSGSKPSVSGNMIQCRPATSRDDFEPGQFPIGANDGATSTKWQPKLANKKSSLTVTFDKGQVGYVKGFHFDWAQAPPSNLTILFHNSSIKDPVAAFDSMPSSKKFAIISTMKNIKVSDPFKPNVTNLAKVGIPTGNTTNITLANPVPPAKYASLIIAGNQGMSTVDRKFNNGTGATVAEWAILRDEKKSTKDEKRRLSQRKLSWDSLWS